MKQTFRFTGTAIVVLVVAAFSITHPAAQTDEKLSFEAASVKENKSGERGQSIRRQPGGRLNATNMPLRSLITFVYVLQPFQLVGDAGWVRDTHFDVVAKMEGDPPPTPPGTGQPDPMMLAMRTLLAERFKLTVHRETREMDIYALVMARPDGKPGPKLTQTTTDCIALMDAARRGGAPPPQAGPNAPVVCGMRGTFGRMFANAMPMGSFASNLSGQLQRVVVDRTGLTGGWDFELVYAPEPPAGPLPPGVELPPVDPSAPSLFTAVQEQLGLKLQSTKGPVEVLVIDHIEQLTGD